MLRYVVKVLVSEYPIKIFGFSKIFFVSKYGKILTESSPPILAIIAFTSESAKASFISLALNSGLL